MQPADLASEILRLWDFGDPAGSESRFRELLDRVAGDAEAAAIVRTQVARAEGLQRRFDEARRTLDDVERAPAARGARVSVRLDLERGRVLRSAGDPEKARPCFAAAFARAGEAGEEALAVDAAHMLALVETDPVLQATWNERALAMAEASADPLARRWCASLLNNMGWTRHGEARYDEALDLFDRALAAREERGDIGPIRIARWSVARTLRSLGRVAEALAAQQNLEAEIGGDVEAGPDGFVFEEIAECLVALDRAPEAAPWYGRAYAILSEDPWFAEAEAVRLERMRAASGIQN